MKKLLLSALLASTASFAAVTLPINGSAGTNTTIGVLPVVVKGNVIEATKLTMELTALDNAGPDGRSMTFNFGDLVKGIGKEDLVGTFRVRLLKKGSGDSVEEHKFDNAPSYALEGVSTGGSNIYSDTTTGNNVKLHYQLGSLNGIAEVTRNEEKLTVTADATPSNVTVGQFTDSSVKIKVTVTNQSTGM